jgi:uncharacterized membrane protein (UPF0127 family)
MSKKKQTKKKFAQQQRKKKNLRIYGVIVILLAAAVYFIFSDTLNDKTTNTNQLNTYTKFDFEKEGELTLQTDKQEFIKRINIEIADDDAQRSTGLMLRDKMSFNQGMLFIFPRERLQSFWMRNTQISLDMLFINKEKKIVTIHQNTKPFSDQSYASDEPAKYVLEVKAGFVEKFGINEGYRVNWTRIK